MVKVSFALAERTGVGEVVGLGMHETWWLLWPAVERPWSALGEPFSSAFA